MPRLTAAVWRPLSRNVGGRITSYDAALLHTDAGNASSLFNWFEKGKYPDGRPCADSSHFYIAKSGVIEQYADTAFMTFTSRDANRRSIGIETQGYGNEPWTDAQVKSIVLVLVWLHKTHGIPVRLMTTSHPSEKGIGWHRLGIDGNFPALPDVRAGRGQRGGGELWSGSFGKACPGDDRIKQMSGIVRAVQAAVNPSGGSTPTVPVVKAWQAVLGLPTDGSWGRDTARVSQLMVTTSTTGSPPKSSVKEVQRIVGVTADGSWGPKSKAALPVWIKKAQRVLNVTADGSWGTRTQQAYSTLSARYSKV